MRSRYTAYVLAEEAYLLASWHASTRPKALELSTSGVRWTGLRVLRCINGGEGDNRGMVEFVASYHLHGKAEQIHELSRFVFEQGRWFYVHGDLQQQKVARNEPCPCGSGKKYNRCCGSGVD
jgi:SEC-C motif-containing protein